MEKHADTTSNTIELKHVAFAHAVNTEELTNAALDDPLINFLEADVIWDGIQPVMGHNPGTPSAFTFCQWMKLVVGRGKGIKVDIKEWLCVDAVLTAVQQANLEIKQGRHAAWPFLRLRHGAVAWFDRPAVMINADVLTGTTSDAQPGCRFNPSNTVLAPAAQVTAAISFVNTVGTRLDDAILSLGWTTVAHPSNGVHAYTSGMIEDMQAVVQELAECSVAFTFAVRATYVRSSWVGLQTLLKYPLTSLTVWAHEQPTAGDLAWMESAIPSTKVMFDLGAPTADWFWDRVAVYALAAAFIGGCWLHTR